MPMACAMWAEEALRERKVPGKQLHRRGAMCACSACEAITSALKRERGPGVENAKHFQMTTSNKRSRASSNWQQTQRGTPARGSRAHLSCFFFVLSSREVPVDFSSISFAPYNAPPLVVFLQIIQRQGGESGAET